MADLSEKISHEADKNRFVLAMQPEDATLNYHWQGDTMVLNHVEVPTSARGGGMGARFAMAVFGKLLDAPHPVRITCTFMRKVARSKPEWQKAFDVV